jgi:hypothetical protein
MEVLAAIALHLCHLSLGILCQQQQEPEMEDKTQTLRGGDCYYVPSSKSLSRNAMLQAWWYTPVIPATWEAETGGSLEPRNSKPTWGKIAGLISKKKACIWVYGCSLAREHCLACAKPQG